MKVSIQKMRTNELRELIKSQLNVAGTLAKVNTEEVYYREARSEALYPHIVFSFESLSLGNNDRFRKDYNLVIDVYTKGYSSIEVEDIADTIEDVFNNANMPAETILPTFFEESRRWIIDEDKAIKHIQLTFIIQNFERY